MDVTNLIQYLLLREKSNIVLPLERLKELANVEWKNLNELIEVVSILNNKLVDESFSIKQMNNNEVIITKLVKISIKFTYKCGKEESIERLAAEDNSIQLDLDEIVIYSKYDENLQLITISPHDNLKDLRLNGVELYKYRIEPYDNGLFRKRINIEYLRISNVKEVFVHHINSRRIDVDSVNARINTVDSEEVYVGFNLYGELMRMDNNNQGGTMATMATMAENMGKVYKSSYFFLINNCNVKSLQIRENIRHFSSLLSTIDKVIFDRNVPFEFGLCSFSSSVIKQVSLSNKVEKLDISNSEINIMRFDKTQISEFKYVTSTITNPLYINTDTFKDLNADACILGMQSSIIQDSYDIYEYFGIERMERKRIKSNKRRESIAYKFLKSSTGYGYKPSKALSFAFKTILFYSLLYFGIDVIGYLIRNPFPNVTLSLLGEVFEKFVLTTYQSGITYTTIGFEDLLSTNPYIGLVYVSEAIIGVSTLSLFVIALTKKYFFGKN